MPDRSNQRRRCRRHGGLAAGLLVAAAALAACAPAHRGASSDVGTAGNIAATAAPTPQARCMRPPVNGALFLRGPMTNWALDDDYQFQYTCHGYVLNVDLKGLYRFRITDAAQTPGGSFGGGEAWHVAPIEAGTPLPLRRNSDPGGAGDLQFEFSGPQTISMMYDVAADGTATNPRIEIGPNSFNDPAAIPVADPIALSARFDSRNAADKAPFGAVVAGTEVHYRLIASPGVTAATLVVERRRLEGPQEVLDYAEVARVPLVRSTAGVAGEPGAPDPSGTREAWSGNFRFAATGVYGYYFEIDVGARKFLYQNNRDSIYWTREKGSGGAGRIGTADDPLHRIRRYRQTVYSAGYHVPDWARDTVFYYIFPERFRNGDRRNDPKPGPKTFHDQSVEVHAHWLDKPWLPRSGDGSDAVYGNDFFGGDLAGITRKLDYIAALGANALYLTPIFRAVSNHKYDTADYRHIDPHFGSDAEFTRLTRAARKHGIRVILDTSLNHTGSDSIYFDRYAKYPQLGAFDGGQIRPDSPYADWYRFDPAQSDPQRQYHGWAGARDLPELNKSSPSFRAFAFGAPDGVMQHWLDRGAAGWRMDVAPWVPDDFWRAWRSAVKAHRPDALTICETQFDAAKFFLGDEFDSTMNYIFRNAVEAYANGADARAIYANIELMREDYPPQAFYALMNLLSTHDTARALYDFGHRSDSDSPATVALAKQRLRLAAFFQMTFPGAPAVFYGDEVGVTGGEDPFNRVTYPWADLGGKPDRRLLADYTRLIRLRRTHAILRHGSIGAPAYIDEHLIVLLRRDGRHVALVAMNNDAGAHSVRVPLPADLANAMLTDAASGARVRAGGAELALTVPARSGRVLETR